MGPCVRRDDDEHFGRGPTFRTAGPPASHPVPPPLPGVPMDWVAARKFAPAADGTNRLTEPALMGLAMRWPATRSETGSSGNRRVASSANSPPERPGALCA